MADRQEKTAFAILKMKNLAAEGQTYMPPTRLPLIRIHIDVVQIGRIHGPSAREDGKPDNQRQDGNSQRRRGRDVSR